MPGGVSTKTYVKFLTAALASMALGNTYNLLNLNKA